MKRRIGLPPRNTLPQGGAIHRLQSEINLLLSRGFNIPLADPLGSTVDDSTFGNPFQSRDLTTVILPDTDTVLFAAAEATDTYPRILYAADGQVGAFFGDGTFDPTANGPWIRSGTGSGNKTLIFRGRTSGNHNATITVASADMADHPTAPVTTVVGMVEADYFGTANTVPAVSFGALAASLPVYDDTGAIVGYAPLYDAPGGSLVPVIVKTTVELDCITGTYLQSAPTLAGDTFDVTMTSIPQKLPALGAGGFSVTINAPTYDDTTYTLTVNSVLLVVTDQTGTNIAGGTAGPFSLSSNQSANPVTLSVSIDAGTDLEASPSMSPTSIVSIAGGIYTAELHVSVAVA